MHHHEHKGEPTDLPSTSHSQKRKGIRTKGWTGREDRTKGESTKLTGTQNSQKGGDHTQQRRAQAQIFTSPSLLLLHPSSELLPTHYPYIGKGAADTGEELGKKTKEGADLRMGASGGHQITKT